MHDRNDSGLFIVTYFRVSDVCKQWPYAGLSSKPVVLSIFGGHEHIDFSIDERAATHLVLIVSFPLKVPYDGTVTRDDLFFGTGFIPMMKSRDIPIGVFC